MLYCQLDYPQELGIEEADGTPITIAQAGCALTSVASMLTNVFGIDINPQQLNQKLIDIDGFATNGAGDFDLLDWSAITKLFPDITLVCNIDYYNPPDGEGRAADMQMIDNYLEKGYSVIVGVSFNHNTKEPTPTHYVLIYRKNGNGTYQMYDPMFRGEECDTIFDTRYAVNGMSVAQCILQVIIYTGPLPQAEQTQPAAPTNAHYKIGDIININTNVPTGKSPDAISFSYGRISGTAPAKVIGFEQYNGAWYYNVDQTMIGGGTGYALVETVDKASIAPVQSSTVVPPTDPSTQVDKTTSGQTTNTSSPDNQTPANASGDQAATSTLPETPATGTTQTPDEQIAQLTQEKADLATKVDEATQKYTEHLSRYQEFVAAGYEKIDDVVKKIEEVDSVTTGLKKQLVQVLTRNKTLNEMLAGRDLEDATAIDEGIKYKYLYKDLSDDMTTIAKIFKTRPTVKDILSAADKIKSAYDKVISQLKSKDVKSAVKTAVATVETLNVQETKQTSVNFLNSLFSFSWLKKN